MPFKPSLMFPSKTGAYLLILGRFLAVPKTIKIDLSKGLPRTKTVAYYKHS